MTEETEYVTCYQYVLETSDSIFHMIHGQTQNITEYFIPVHNVAFNLVDDYQNGSKINVFGTDKPRAPTTEEIKFPKSVIDSILLMEEHNKRIKAIKDEIAEITDKTLDDKFFGEIGFVKDCAKTRMATFHARLAKA